MYYINNKESMKSKMLSSFKNKLLGVRLLGTSMGPFIRSGNTVVIKRIPFNDIHIGDVIIP